MGITEINLELSAEQKSMRDEARKFFREVWRPASIELDQISTAEGVIAEDSVLWETGGKTFELGYHKIGLPQVVGGLELPPLSIAIITEEMGYASPGLAACWMVCSSPFGYALLSPDPQAHELTRRFCEDTQAKMTGCWAITEPEHGSDWLLMEGEHMKDPVKPPQVTATLNGDEYVINGQKAAWVSNGTIASYAVLFLSLDPAKGMDGGGIALVPLDVPGVTRGKPWAKLGQRDLNQGEIFFDNVRIPAAYMVCPDPGIYPTMLTAQLAGANAWMGSCFTGVAHSAYDEALKFAKERVQGGKPIFQHQNIKLKLFEMFTAVEAARCLSRQVMVFNSGQSRGDRPPALEYSMASKIMATETAFKVANQAVQICGGVGLSQEYVIEKIFRDARMALIQDGVNEVLALGGAANL